MNCTEDSRACKEQLTVVLLLLRAAEAANQRVDRPSNEFAIRHYYCGFTLVYSVKHQQVARKRSVSSVEIVL